MSASDPKQRRLGKDLPTILFWIGVGLAPVAAGLMLLTQSSGPLRVAATLAILSVTLIGLSITLRRDASTTSTTMESTVTEELELLREDVRDDIRTAAKATHSALLREIQALRGEVEALRGSKDNPPHPATAGVPAPQAPPGVVRHTETVQVTTRQTTLTADHPHVHVTTYPSGERDAMGYAPGESDTAGYPPHPGRQGAREYGNRPAIDTTRVETPPPVINPTTGRAGVPEPIRHRDAEYRLRGGEDISDAPRSRWEAPSAPEWQQRETRGHEEPEPTRRRGHEEPEPTRWRGHEEPEPTRWHGHEEPEPNRRRADDSRGSHVERHFEHDRRHPDVESPTRTRRASRRAEENEQGFAAPHSQHSPAFGDPWADLRPTESAGETWAQARSDQHVEELHIGERRAEVRSDRHSEELRIDERQAEIRSSKHGREMRVTGRWATIRQESSGEPSRRRSAVPESWEDDRDRRRQPAIESSWRERRPSTDYDRGESSWPAPPAYEDSGHRSPYSADTRTDEPLLETWQQSADSRGLDDEGRWR